MSIANPFPTVGIIIEIGQEIVFIERINLPFGWAILGELVDYGESLAEVARHDEAFEEKGLKIELMCQFHTYSA